MQKLIDFFLDNYIFLIIFYVIIIVLIIYLLSKIRHYFRGNFKEGNVYPYLKSIYNKFDYPYIKQIILPINKDTHAYYDAIIFGDRFIYIIEIKNHDGLLKIDPLEDWVFIERNLKQHLFTNAFYENELKKHILNRFLDIDKNRIVEVVINNNKCKIIGEKKNNHIVAPNQLSSLIKYYEAKTNISKMAPDFIEKKGNFILDTNIKNRKIRREVINNLINGHFKN